MINYGINLFNIKRKIKNIKIKLNKLKNKYFQTKKDNNNKKCRICYDEIETQSNKLICPCKCNGSIKWIHEKCLIKWIDISHKMKCQQCKYNYKTKIKYFNLDYAYLHNNIVKNILSCLTFLILTVLSILFQKLCFQKTKFKIYIVYNVLKNFVVLFSFITLFLYLIPKYRYLISIFYNNISFHSFNSHPIIEAVLIFYNIIYNIINFIIKTYFPMKKKMLFLNYH